MMTRREFAAGLAVAATLACSGCSSVQVEEESPAGSPEETEVDVPEDGPALVDAEIEPLRVFDLHCDTVDTLAMHDWEPYKSEPEDRHEGDLVSNDAALDLDRLNGMAWCQNYAVWVPDSDKQPDPLGFYRHGAAYFKEQCKAHPDRIEQILDARDIDGVLGRGMAAGILMVENAAPCNEGIHVVDEFAQDGVKIVTLTWNGENSLGGGAKTHQGLTAYGREVVAAFEDRGIVCDCSHLSDESFSDLLVCHRRPFVASHSNLRSVCGHQRNLTDDQFRAICDTGGIVGLNYYRSFVTDRSTDGKAPADGEVTFDELAAHVERFLDLGGENCLALGSDYDGSDVPEWLNGVQKIPAFHARMVERFGQTIVDKIFFTNARDFWVRYENDSER